MQALEYAAEWRRHCWNAEGSILSSSNLWTRQNAQELYQKFVQEPIIGTDLSFFEKLKKQLDPTSRKRRS